MKQPARCSRARAARLSSLGVLLVTSSLALLDGEATAQIVEALHSRKAPQADWVPARVLDARCGHALAYDVARQRVVLFGGGGNTGVLSDTWEWDGSNWTQRAPTNSPSSRVYHAMAYDAARQRVVLFGGYAANSSADGVSSGSDSDSGSEVVMAWRPRCYFVRRHLAVGRRRPFCRMDPWPRRSSVCRSLPRLRARRNRARSGSGKASAPAPETPRTRDGPESSASPRKVACPSYGSRGAAWRWDETPGQADAVDILEQIGDARPDVIYHTDRRSIPARTRGEDAANGPCGKAPEPRDGELAASIRLNADASGPPTPDEPEDHWLRKGSEHSCFSAAPVSQRHRPRFNDDVRRRRAGSGEGDTRRSVFVRRAEHRASGARKRSGPRRLALR